MKTRRMQFTCTKFDKVFDHDMIVSNDRRERC